MTLLILSNSFLNLFYLSDAPHAVPHAALTSVSAFFFHPKRFDNAILFPPNLFVCCYLCYKIIISGALNRQKYALFYYIGLGCQKPLFDI